MLLNETCYYLENQVFEGVNNQDLSLIETCFRSRLYGIRTLKPYLCALTTQFSFLMKFFFDSMEIVKSFCFLIDCLPCGAMCAAPELPSTLSQKNQEMHFARSCLDHQNQRRSDGHGNGPFLKWA